MAEIELAVIGAQLDAGFQRLRARHEAQERRVLEAMSTLRSALATDDRLATAEAASALCDAEYSATGECDGFGPVLDALEAAGLVPEGFDEQYVNGGEETSGDG